MQPILIVTTLFPLVLVSCVLPTLGRSRRGILFGVTVPLEFAESTAARGALHRFQRNVILVALLLLTVTVGGLLVARPWAQLSVLTAPVPLELVVAWALWERERRAMKSHAAVVPVVRSVNLAEVAEGPYLGGVYATLAALLPLAAAATWLRMHWSQLPARWPQHWNAAGVADGWATKSFMGAFLPLLLGGLVILLLAGVSAFLSMAPGPQSAERRAALAPLAVLTWLISVIIALTELLPLRQGVSANGVLATVLTPILAMLAVTLWLLWRVARASRRGDVYDGTPDSGWRAGGLIYYNPSDASVLVAKRYGWGWTLNFARPIAWAYIGGMLAVLLLFTVLPSLLR
jgi:uncharacterized membrane protein